MISLSTALSIGQDNRGYCTKYQSQNDEAKERMELTNRSVGRQGAAS
jgi:hypothetical protein